ncbi:MAG TPA: hypothetical protein VHU83_13035 [Bryobacteraceae bacterium]|nr:hypothetical protein [Bryobacteraceae bacterium]
MLLLYFGVPVFLVIAGWRWAAGMLGELRAIRKDLDEVAITNQPGARSKRGTISEN